MAFILPEGGPRFKKLPVYFGLVTLVIALIAAAYSLWTNKDYIKGKIGQGPLVAAQVGSKTITQDEVNNFAERCFLSPKEAVEYLVDEKVLTSWAENEQITISKEMQEAEEIRISGIPAVDKCTATRARVNLLREKLSQKAVKFREGKFIVVNFDHYLPNPLLSPPDAKTEAEREKKLSEDRSYAEKLINSISADLKAGKLNFEQAMEKVQKDPKVGLKSTYATSLQSGSFAAEDYIKRNGLLDFDSVREKVDSLAEGAFSEPFIQKVSTKADGSGPFEDARWVIIKVNKIGVGVGGTAEELLNQIRNKYGARIFLK